MIQHDIRRLFRPVLIGCTLALTVAACTSDRQRGICPRVAILDQASVVTAFAPGAPERPENVRYTAEITDIEVQCTYQDQLLFVMDADLTLKMNVRRGPAMQGNQAELRYFVAVTDRRGNVLGKEVFEIDVNLGGQEQVQRVERTWQNYRFERAGSGIAFETWVGFQLTDNQLEYVRRQRNTAQQQGS